MAAADHIDAHPCLRCGVSCYPDFCTDCQETDPDMCAGGQSARQRVKVARALRKKERDFWAEIHRLGDPSEHRRNQRRRRKVAA